MDYGPPPECWCSGGAFKYNPLLPLAPDASPYVLNVVGIQEALADHVAGDPLSHCVLEALQKLVGEG